MRIKLITKVWDESENEVVVWKGDSNQLDLVLDGLLEANKHLEIWKDGE